MGKHVISFGRGMRVPTTLLCFHPLLPRSTCFYDTRANPLGDFHNQVDDQTDFNATSYATSGRILVPYNRVLWGSTAEIFNISRSSDPIELELALISAKLG